jgi:hypothetical protein
MNVEAYATGFSKVAESYGVDPVALFKYASSGGQFVSEIAGLHTAPTIATGLLMRNPLLALGAVGAHVLGGPILAALTKKRSGKAQFKHDTNINGSTLANLLIPGSATYNLFKRIGAESSFPDPTIYKPSLENIKKKVNDYLSEENIKKTLDAARPIAVNASQKIKDYLAEG